MGTKKWRVRGREEKGRGEEESESEKRYGGGREK
jgi:hypothetical protein